MSDFKVETTPGRVSFSGEIDLDNTLVVRQALDLAAASGDSGILVDLSQTTFIDSSGLNELVRPTHDGHTVTICGASPLVLRLFEVTGLDVVLRVER